MRLRTMRPEEFADYLAYFLPDYAAEISANYDVDMASARARAESEIARSFPEGVASEGQILLCIVTQNDDAVIGYLWCRPDFENHSLFISDFYILPAHRGQGYGRSALLALETMFCDRGITEIRLRVAANNFGAERLYRALGYRVTGINMRKPVAGPARP